MLKFSQDIDVPIKKKKQKNDSKPMINVNMANQVEAQKDELHPY